MRQAADNIKRKKALVSAFLEYTGEESWETLQKRFPHHATEEKLAQFKGVPIKRNKASPVSRNLCVCCMTIVVIYMVIPCLAFFTQNCDLVVSESNQMISRYANCCKFKTQLL